MDVPPPPGAQDMLASMLGGKKECAAYVTESLSGAWEQLRSSGNGGPMAAFNTAWAQLVAPILSSDPTEARTCLLLLVSKLLSFGIIAGASIVKLPQILTLLSALSGNGVSCLGAMLELCCTTITLAYNVRHGNPFSTWGETLFVCVQNAVLAALLLVLPPVGDRWRSLLVPFFITYMAIQVPLYAGGAKILAALITALRSLPAVLPVAPLIDALSAPHIMEAAAAGDMLLSTVTYLQSLTIPIFILSKAPQLLQNWRAGHTGMLSRTTTFLVAAGSSARVFTTWQELSGDTVLLAGFVMGATMNLVVAGQVVWYASATKKAMQKMPAGKVSKSKKNK